MCATTRVPACVLWDVRATVGVCRGLSVEIRELFVGVGFLLMRPEDQIPDSKLSPPGSYISDGAEGINLSNHSPPPHTPHG